jgi:cobalt-precorrin-5B (C1)-methyltransferase
VTATPHEPPLSPEMATSGGLREGWTTGTCASAAAKAAAVGLLTGVAPDVIEIALPGGRRVSFPTADLDPAAPYRVAVVKDAGDDPDVTDRAHVTAEVRWAPTGTRAGVAILAQPGQGHGPHAGSRPA